LQNQVNLLETTFIFILFKLLIITEDVLVQVDGMQNHIDLVAINPYCFNQQTEESKVDQRDALRPAACTSNQKSNEI